MLVSMRTLHTDVDVRPARVGGEFFRGVLQTAYFRRRTSDGGAASDGQEGAPRRLECRCTTRGVEVVNECATHRSKAVCVFLVMPQDEMRAL